MDKTKTRAKTPTTTKNPYSLNICEKHTGKIQGMISLNTSTLQNALQNDLYSKITLEKRG